MATFYPDYNTILNDKMEKHTAGELQLLNALRALDDSYQVYFQSHINFSHPDVVILKEGCGVLLIEVKDWHLDSYTFHPGQKKNDLGFLTVSGSSAILSTPFGQVMEYKKELFKTCLSLHSRGLDSQAKNQGRNYAFCAVRTAVFFSCSSDQEVKKLFSDGTGKCDFGVRHGAKTYKEHHYYWTNSDVNVIAKQVGNIMTRNDWYTCETHEEMKRLLKPSEEWAEQMEPFTLSPVQEELAKSGTGRIRVRGVAGSGKTLVIAQKAVNCYRDKKKPVLILTYNITMTRYIEDKIACLTRDMPQWERRLAFHVFHFDGFLSSMQRNYGLKNAQILPEDSTEDVWEQHRQDQMQSLRNISGKIQKYSTILIDEAQDYKPEWFAFINEIFMEDDPDYLITADEKQNIYGRETDRSDKMPVVTGFRGPWRKLGKSFRLSDEGKLLATDFQREYMADKYKVDKPQQLSMELEPCKRKYVSLSDFDARKIYDVIREFTQSGDGISPNDVCILAEENYKMRDINAQFSTRGIGTQITCETAEEYNLINRIHADNEDRKKAELREIRTLKKRIFRMNPGVVKICTVQSFKGWEINTVVLIIDPRSETVENNDELVYTGITRAKKNLLVIGCGNTKYDRFFEERLNQNGARANA